MKVTKYLHKRPKKVAVNNKYSILPQYLNAILFIHASLKFGSNISLIEMASSIDQP